ncbi:peroxide stress protein YaaA [Pseudactinotalea sp. HY158]|nr:peroxide stress protein YaaA [Pseudactinotalea sp. HY158]
MVDSSRGHSTAPGPGPSDAPSARTDAPTAPTGPYAGGVLLLLPPSEGKTAPASGRPLDLSGLSHPELTEQRRRVLTALLAASESGPGALGLPASMAGAVAANVSLLEAPTAPAARVYTGVLYAASGLADLTGTARSRASRHVRIASALFGMLTPADAIPAYRLPPTAKLPGLPGGGTSIAALAPPTSAAMSAEEPGLVVDCRSGPYIRLWRPRPPTEWVCVRVVQLRDGVPTVVSHDAKHTRGLLTGHLLTRAGRMPRTAEQLLGAAGELVGTVLAGLRLEPATGPGPRVLELTLPA